MEENKALIGALIFIVMIVGANFIMYAIARGATNSKQKSFLETLSRSLNTSPKKKDESMDELRRRMQELEKSKKDKSGDSE